MIAHDHEYKLALLSAALREAWAIGKPLEIFGNGEANKITILQIVEEGTGRRKVAKSILCEVDSKVLSGQLENAFTLRLSAGDATYVFLCEVTDLSEKTCGFAISGEINRWDNRSFTRTKLRDEGLNVVSISDGNISFPGFLKFLDFSLRSFGVEITSRIHMLEGHSYRVSGVATLNNYPLTLEVAKTTAIKTVVSSEANTFRIRCGLEMSQDATAPIDYPNRLSERVLTQQLSISISSCLIPVLPISVEVLNASSSGFYGRLTRKTDQQLLWRGCGVRFGSSDLYGLVVENRDDNIRVVWNLDGGTGDKIWTNLVLGQRGVDSDLAVTDADDLLNTFIKSGTASPLYLENISILRPAIISGISQEHTFQDWHFKWIERAGGGRIKGHIAAYRLGDNLWCAGDLFSDPDAREKISTSFTRRFLQQFVDYLQRRSPFPKVYGAWKLGHPYWRETDRHLDAHPEDLYTDLVGHTHFISAKTETPRLENCEITEVRARSLKEIEDIHEKLGAVGTKAFFSAFDFDADRFGSPQLTALFRSYSFHFRRRYFVFSNQKSNWFFMASKFPFGVSPYGNTTVIFASPLSPGAPELSAQEKDMIGNHCAKLGVFPHRLVVLGPKSSEASGDLPVRIVISTPSMWLHV